MSDAPPFEPPPERRLLADGRLAGEFVRWMERLGAQGFAVTEVPHPPGGGRLWVVAGNSAADKNVTYAVAVQPAAELIARSDCISFSA